MDDLEHTLRLRRSEPVEKLTREKGDLLDALETLRHDYEKLKLQTSLEPIGSRLGTSSPDSSRIRDLESRLATVQAEVDVKSRQIKELTEESEAVEGRMRILRNEGATAFTIRELDDLKEQLRILRNEKNNLAGALSDSEAEKEKLRGALTDAQSELSHLTEISEELEIIRSNLADETRRREEADRLNKHHVDMIELAEKEMSTLQERIAHFEELDQQRRTILVKYQAVKEEIQLMDERISVKDEEIKELQKRLQTGGNSAPSIVISKASRSTEDVSVKQLIEERDAALADRAHLQRMNMSIEHEKKLLEKELATIKEALDDFKTETGLRQQQELLTKAGTIINELGRAADWSLMTPIKSIAAFMRIYKPAEVDVEALQAEYDSLLASFAHPERQQPRYTTEGSGPFCGICHRSGHVATQCENMSDGDDVGLGFSLSTENIAGDPRAFSA
jgi:chromosome segregation ATPase